MPAGESKTIYRSIVALCSLLVFAFLSFWIYGIVSEFKLIATRDDLGKAIARGDADSVISLVDRIDPSWAASADVWSGDANLRSQPGFSWLMDQWMRHEHPHGIERLFKLRIERSPDFSREELADALKWSRDRSSRESFEALFDFALGLEYPEGNAGAERTFALILEFAEDDARLALLAWEAHEQGRLIGDLPEKVIKSASQKSSFAHEDSLHRLLSLMGLFDAVETFVAREAIPDPSKISDATWIERTYRVLADGKNQEVKRARELLDPADATPETPGLFLLNRFLEDSVESSYGGYPELSPAEIEPALDIFRRLPPDGKSTVADLIDRNIPDYGDHVALHRWVGEHVRPGWEKRRERFLATTADEIDAIWQSWELGEWLRTAAKHHFAEESTVVVMDLHRLRERKRRRPGHFDQYTSQDSHPFFLSKIQSYWTREGTDPLPAQFSLLLAFARDPSLTPCENFPDLRQMGYLKVNGPRERSPWYQASADEFNNALTALGEPFVDDPLRFLIVPFFHELENNFSKTLQQPEVLAEFQRLAASNDRPGGWLAKDLADLLPRWWCRTKETHDALLAAGGHSWSYERLETYLANRATPVAARVSYALGTFDWHMARFALVHSARIGVTEPYYPAIDDLALEFAQAFERETWSFESIPLSIWNSILQGWFTEPATPDDREQARNRKLALQALRSRFDPYVRDKFASPPAPSRGFRLTGLDEIAPFLEIYARMLHLDGDEEALSTLWEDTERTMINPKAVFGFLKGNRGDRSQVLGSASADTIVRRYRKEGWDGVRDQVSSMDGPTAYSALSEATSLLNFREWIDFCGKALDLRHEPFGPGDNGWDRFCAFPPAAFVKTIRAFKTNERIGYFAAEFSGVEIPQKHEGFFALALPVLIGHGVSFGESGNIYTEALANPGSGSVSPLILREFDTARNPGEVLLASRHLDALRSGNVPLAQRLVGSTFFQIRRSEQTIYFLRNEQWPDELRALAETGVDLLIAAIDQKMPVWLLLDRGLGLLDSSTRHPHLTVTHFLSLYRQDKAAQQGRASALMEDKRLVEMLKEHPDRKLLLTTFYHLALQSNDRALAVALFLDAERNLTFEEKLFWLSVGKFHAPMAHLFTREWRRIDDLTVGFTVSSHGDEVESILSALPDDPDLLRLVNTTLRYGSMSTKLVNPGSQRVLEQSRAIVRAFLSSEFKSPEMEALCLVRLPVRMEQSPALSVWLDDRLKGRDWKAMLSEASPSIRKEWPYWSRKLEALAGSGDFEALLSMLPEAGWFKRRPHRFDDGYSESEDDTIEEMVWMGFARPVAHQLRFGSPEDRLDAGAVAARLLNAPPHSKRLDEIRQSISGSNYRATSFHPEAANELWLYSIAATLSATLDEPSEVAIARCDKFELPPVRSVLYDPLVMGANHQAFFRLLADFGETMTEGERKRFFLRSFETGPFKWKTMSRYLPCYSLAKIQLPRQISIDYMIHLATARNETASDSAFSAADLGLVHHLAGDDAKALPLLERALGQLDPGRTNDTDVLNAIRTVHARIVGGTGRKATTPDP